MRILPTFAVAFFAITVVLISLLMFNSSVGTRLEDSTTETLGEISMQQQFTFKAALDNERTALESISETLTLIGRDEVAITEYLATIQDLYGISTLIVCDNKGVGIISDFSIVDISQKDYFINAMNGDFYMSEPYVSLISDDIVLTAAIPIYVDGKVDGVLAAEYTIDYLRLFLSEAFGGQSYTTVVNNNGIVMLESYDLYGPGANLYEIFNLVAIANSRSADDVLADVYEGRGGSIEYTFAGETKLGDYRPLEFNGWTILTLIPSDVIDEEVSGIFGSMTIVTIVSLASLALFLLYIMWRERRNLKMVEKLAYYDELTGLYNLTKLKIEAKNLLTHHPNTEFVIIKFDFVNFKAINELFSFEIGNDVLRKVKVVSDTVTDSSYFHARVGTDEFMFFAKSSVFEDFKNTRFDFERMFVSLLTGVERHLFKFRYGRYIIPKGFNDIDEIVNRVNLAHTITKEAGAEEFCDYDDSFKMQLLKVTEITNKMKNALKNSDFKTYLQPKHKILTGEIVGAEALVRWIEPDGNTIYPNEFIPLFESNGFITELDKFMLKSVCKLQQEWHEQGRDYLPISVNFSRLHLENPCFVQEIIDIANAYDVPHNFIEIELTETVLTDKEGEFEGVLESLHQNGFAISIDDFGSGYSSLGMLKNFKVDTLKIDRSFFVNSRDSERGKAVVKSVIDLAHKLNMYTVAEGVELKEQIDFLKEIDCSAAQGYFYTKPMPIAEFNLLEW